MTPDLDTFWQNAAQGRLTFQCCEDCGYVRWPVAPICPECLSDRTRWREDEGRGTVWSFVVYHRAYRGDLKPHVPYNVALVELDSGVRFVSRIVEAAAEGIGIGDRVEVLLRPIFDGPAPVPVFRPLP